MITKKPPNGRLFEKGNPGRRKGSKNKSTVEVRKMAKRIVDDPEYLDLLAKRIKVGKAPHMEALLWHYAHGKPQERLEHTGADGGPILTVYVPAKDAQT